MKAKNKVVYVPPVNIVTGKHEVTSLDDKNNPLRSSFHTDVSLLQRIDTMRADAQTLREIKESLQPMIDTSNFRSQFEEIFGSLTDDELINSCPSRYVQTASEKMSYLKELAALDKMLVKRHLPHLRRRKRKIGLIKKIRNFNLVFWKSLNNFVYVD